MKIAHLAPCLIIVLLVACSIAKPIPAKQGITGYIYELRGNQMPALGRPQSKGHGVKRDIYIYQPTTLTQTQGNNPLFTLIKTKLIAHTQSDSTGHYWLVLPAGKYSVFVAEGSRFFAAQSDGVGVLNPVMVQDNHITQKDITITINAVY